MTLVYGTCVEIDGHGLLLRGPPGCGKSDLALRLIDGGARLVADDQTRLERRDETVVASAPASIAGMLEVRGIGILRVPRLASVPIALVIDLAAPEAVERLPGSASCEYLGVALPLVVLDPFVSSAAAKVRVAMRVANGDIVLVR